MKKFIIFIFILIFFSCNSKYKYTTKLDMEILKSIQEVKVEKLLSYFAEQVEFDYSQEAYTMFHRAKDSKELLSGNISEYYRFLFELNPELKEKSWLSFKEALAIAYRVEAENNEVNEDGTYFRNIHIYTDSNYNRITLKCIDENSCQIISLLISASNL